MSDGHFLIFIATGTRPGQACIVDIGGLVNGAVYICQIAEQKLGIEAVHLRCLKRKRGNRGKHGQYCSWCLVPGRLGRNCPFSCRSGVINI